MTITKQTTDSPITMVRVAAPIDGSRRFKGFSEIIRQAVHRSKSWREEYRSRRRRYRSWPTVTVVTTTKGTMPVTTPASLHVASLGHTSPRNQELILKNLARQLLGHEELRIFKQTLQHFRMTRSVPSLCTSLRPLITSTERLMLLVELAEHMPSEALRRDFQRLCTLSFPKYHTFLRYFTPQPVTDGSKVIAQDATGQYLVATKVFTKKSVSAQANGERLSKQQHYATFSALGPHNGFDDGVNRHTNGKVIRLRKEENGTFASAPATLQRPQTRHIQPNSQFSTWQRQDSIPLKILSGSFQSLAFSTETGRYHKRILLARRTDGSIGVGIQGGQDYGTPIIVCMVEADSQAAKQGLKIGDRIIDVNGKNFTELTHAEAVTAMRNAWNIIMTVETGPAGDKDNDGPTETAGNSTDVDIVVYPGVGGRLGCAVNRDKVSGDITVHSVEKNLAADNAGMLPGDVILEMDGIKVKTLTDLQISALTNNRQVRLKLRRNPDEDSSKVQPVPNDTILSDDVFSPQDFSSPAPAWLQDDNFTFISSTPRSSGRSRSEERILTISRSRHSAPKGEGGMWRTLANPDIYRCHAAHSEGNIHKIFRPKMMAVPSSRSHQKIDAVQNGGPGKAEAENEAYLTTTRGRSKLRTPVPVKSKHTIVYSTARGRSAEGLLHPEMNGATATSNYASGMTTQSRNGKFIYVRNNRSRSRETAIHAAISPEDREVLQAVYSGKQKREQAINLSMTQMPDNDDAWRIS